MELTTRDGMPPSNIEKSSTGPSKRARSSSPNRLSRSPSPQPDIAAPKRIRYQFDYIGGLSGRERVDLVLARLAAEHRWTIKDLIYHMVTEEPQKKYGASTKKRARDISMAIFDEPEVIDVLSRASDHLRDHQSLKMAKVFQKELHTLRLETGLGEFNAEIDPQDLNISGLADRAKELAPGLWRFMQDVIEPPSAGNHVNGDLFMICMIFAPKAPSKHNSFHMLLGIHLHSMGVKRRTINLLAGLGITVSYQTIITYTNNVAKIPQ
jgi:hypothetical protein